MPQVPCYMHRLMAAIFLVVTTAQAQKVDPALLNGLNWRLIGPFRAGRALAVTGVPNNPDKFYFGSVGGGVWETENDGRTWSPIFDGQPDASIGAIAVAPSDPNVIYVGTGEADMRNDIQQGHGIYKSTDTGHTWTHIGLDDTRQIGKVIVDPRDPNTLYVAALGHQYGPNEQRGVFKSSDGGQTWSKVLYKGPDIGAIDIDIDPTDDTVLYASLWHTRRPPWSYYPPSNGPGSGLFKSTDSGETWTQIQGHGFPSFVGRVGIAVSPANHDRVYAFVDTNDFRTGGIYRSDDAGVSWQRTASEPRLWTRGWYFAGITADPKNPDVVYDMNTSTYRSTDGGKTFIPIKGAPGGDDYHTLWIEPDNPDRMILACDQGVVVSVDGARSWSSWYNQPTAQIYHVITDNRFPYWVYGAQQDSGAVAVPSRTIHSGISALDWRPIDAGGESGTIAPDQLHPGLLLSNGGVREQFETAWEQNVDPTVSHTDTLWRSEWTQPIAASPLDPKVFYLSHQKIFRTADEGLSWQIISPDLTRPTNTDPPNLDPATKADNDGLPRRGVVYWIAPSPIKAHQIWAGTDDGLIWLTRDEGAHWQNVTPPTLTPWSKVGIIDASHFDPNTAYAAIDRHRIDDDHPYIYKTSDAGKHWKLIVTGIPANQFVNVVREDPRKPGLLYAGTDWGIFVSFDDGAHWQSLQRNLPAASVRDIVFHGSDIVIATHGRSMWILDNASPLRHVTSTVSTTLIRPDAAILFQRAGTFGFGAFDEGTPFPPEEPQAPNPQWGAVFDYVLTKSDKTVLFTIQDLKGKLIRRLSSSDKPRTIDLNAIDIPAYWVHPEPGLSVGPGAHRYVWNLRYKDDGGPVVPPGQYQITLSAGSVTQTQPLEVLRDPRVAATESDLRAQFDLTLQVDAEMRQVEAALSRAREILAKHGTHLKPAAKSHLLALIGGRGGMGTPDEGGAASQDTESFGVILGGLGALRGQIQSAPAAPAPEHLKAFKTLKAKAQQRITLLKSLTS